MAHTGDGLVDLWEASPSDSIPTRQRQMKSLTVLFPGNPLLCCAWWRHRFDTRPRENWYKLQDLQFIVPSPMTAKLGITGKGKYPLTHETTQDRGDF